MEQWEQERGQALAQEHLYVVQYVNGCVSSGRLKAGSLQAYDGQRLEEEVGPALGQETLQCVRVHL